MYTAWQDSQGLDLPTDYTATKQYLLHQDPACKWPASLCSPFMQGCSLLSGQSKKTNISAKCCTSVLGAVHCTSVLGSVHGIRKYQYRHTSYVKSHIPPYPEVPEVPAVLRGTLKTGQENSTCLINFFYKNKMDGHDGVGLKSTLEHFRLSPTDNIVMTRWKPSIVNLQRKHRTKYSPTWVQWTQFGSFLLTDSYLCHTKLQKTPGWETTHTHTIPMHQNKDKE